MVPQGTSVANGGEVLRDKACPLATPLLEQQLGVGMGGRVPKDAPNIRMAHTDAHFSIPLVGKIVGLG